MSCFFRRAGSPCRFFHKLPLICRFSTYKLRPRLQKPRAGSLEFCRIRQTWQAGQVLSQYISHPPQYWDLRCNRQYAERQQLHHYSEPVHRTKARPVWASQGRCPGRSRSGGGLLRCYLLGDRERTSEPSLRKKESPWEQEPRPRSPTVRLLSKSLMYRPFPRRARSRCSRSEQLHCSTQACHSASSHNC